jgi:hypothetical protein
MTNQIRLLYHSKILRYFVKACLIFQYCQTLGSFSMLLGLDKQAPRYRQMLRIEIQLLFLLQFQQNLGIKFQSLQGKNYLC